MELESARKQIPILLEALGRADASDDLIQIEL